MTSISQEPLNVPWDDDLTPPPNRVERSAHMYFHIVNALLTFQSSFFELLAGWGWSEKQVAQALADQCAGGHIRPVLLIKDLRTLERLGTKYHANLPREEGERLLAAGLAGWFCLTPQRELCPGQVEEPSLN